MNIAALKDRLARAAGLADSLPATGAGRLALPAALSLFFSLYRLARPGHEGLFAELNQIDLGGFLLLGLPHPSATMNMPLTEMLVSAALNLGVSPALFFVLLHLSVFFMVFVLGCLARGYWAGIAALLAAGLFGGGTELIYEQAYYSFFLLLSLAFLILQLRERSAALSLLCGLSIGCSLLVRTPLFLFPPLAALLAGAGEKGGARWRRAVLLTAGAYALLLPWGLLNRQVTGEFELFDTRRSANNVVLAAMGRVYSTFGTSRESANIRPGETAVGYYLREAAARPLFHAKLFLRRLWHIFLFYPALIGLLLLAIFRYRERGRALYFSLPVYFILIHAPLALEKRYFYPLTYLLPPLLAGALWPRGMSAGPECRGEAVRAAKAFFLVSFAGVLIAEAFILAYPARARANAYRPGLYAEAAGRLPMDRKLAGLKCAELWAQGYSTEYLACQARYAQTFEDGPRAYFLAVLDSTAPAAVPMPSPEKERADMELYLSVRMYRELELGDKRAALASYARAHALFFRQGPASEADMQNIDLYEEDRAVRARLARNDNWFWEGPAYRALSLWPRDRLPRLLARAAAVFPVYPRAARLGAMAVRAASGAPDARLLEQMTGDNYGPGPGEEATGPARPLSPAGRSR